MRKIRIMAVVSLICVFFFGMSCKPEDLARFLVEKTNIVKLFEEESDKNDEKDVEGDISSLAREPEKESEKEDDPSGVPEPVEVKEDEIVPAKSDFAETLPIESQMEVVEPPEFADAGTVLDDKLSEVTVPGKAENSTENNDKDEGKNRDKVSAPNEKPMEELRDWVKSLYAKDSASEAKLPDELSEFVHEDKHVGSEEESVALGEEQSKLPESGCEEELASLEDDLVELEEKQVELSEPECEEKSVRLEEENIELPEQKREEELVELEEEHSELSESAYEEEPVKLEEKQVELPEPEYEEEPVKLEGEQIELPEQNREEEPVELGEKQVELPETTEMREEPTQWFKPLHTEPFKYEEEAMSLQEEPVLSLPNEYVPIVCEDVIPLCNESENLGDPVVIADIIVEEVTPSRNESENSDEPVIVADNELVEQFESVNPVDTDEKILEEQPPLSVLEEVRNLPTANEVVEKYGANDNEFDGKENPYETESVSAVPTEKKDERKKRKFSFQPGIGTQYMRLEYESYKGGMIKFSVPLRFNVPVGQNYTVFAMIKPAYAMEFDAENGMKGKTVYEKDLLLDGGLGFAYRKKNFEIALSAGAEFFNAGTDVDEIEFLSTYGFFDVLLMPSFRIGKTNFWLSVPIEGSLSFEDEGNRVLSGGMFLSVEIGGNK